MPAAAVESVDEQLHAPLPDPLWSESYYFNFSDAAGRGGGFARISRQRSGDEAEGLLCLYLPDGIGVAHVKTPAPRRSDGAISAGALVFECEEPLARWRIRYDGDLHLLDDPRRIPEIHNGHGAAPPMTGARLDLVLTGLHAPFYYPDYRRVPEAPPHVARHRGGVAGALRRAARLPGEIASALRMRSGRHYEQSLAVRGAVVVNRAATGIDGTGHRDHSWGVRDWSILRRMRWLSGQMSGLAFNVVYISVPGSHVTNGYVCEDGRVAPVDIVRLATTFTDDGLAGRTIGLELGAGGRQYHIAGEVLLNVPLPIDGPGFSTMYTVGRTRYTCGDRTGYGVAEFLERLRP